MTTATDRIEKKVVLRAPRERVWKAISDARQFGTWFGVEFDGPFVAGAAMMGRITPTKVDPEVARMQEPYTGMAFDCTIERIEPMRLFSFRWHPFAIDPGVDYSKEPTTLVTFELEEVPGGTQLTITETGFDKIPLERRAKAFEANAGGWTHQIDLLTRYLAGAART
ncbi:MAG TPA: SRPBCC family protein [Kofleriaceae bacterium]|nr:SRPBCC family protein [Kofleriaceae bacterium]